MKGQDMNGYYWFDSSGLFYSYLGCFCLQVILASMKCRVCGTSKCMYVCVYVCKRKRGVKTLRLFVRIEKKKTGKFVV